MTIGRSSFASYKIVRTVFDTDQGRAFAKVGVRINLQNGEWWFCHKSGSWSHHMPGVQMTDRLNRPLFDKAHKPILGPERVLRYADDKNLQAKLGHCEGLVESLIELRDHLR